MTVLEAIQRSTKFLLNKGVDTPRLQAELLLAHLLRLPRMRLYLNFERSLSSAEIDSLRAWIQRRGQREPLQYIIGSTSFCGLELAVNSNALIPRPETELLAEQGWTFLNGEPSSSFRSALDFGTGTGCLAIVLAVKCPAARIQALDISPKALELARQNATHLGVAEPIGFIQGEGLEALPKESRFDLIITNPPYIPTAEIQKLEPEVRYHEPTQALDGGPDGLDYFRRLAAQAGPFLKPGGKLMAEFGDGQAQPLTELFEQQNWIVESVLNDYTQRPRIIILRAQHGKPLD